MAPGRPVSQTGTVEVPAASDRARRTLRRAAAPAWRGELLRVGAIAVVLGAWQASGLFMNPIFMSTPYAVLSAFLKIVADGSLPRAFASSLGEMAAGLSIATAAGFGIGIAMGRFRLAERLFDPFVNFFNATPTIALLPLMEIWFGTDVRSRIAFIVVICVWTLVINALAGVRNVKRGYAEVGAAFGLGPLATTWKIFIPAAMPYLLAGMRVAMAQAAVGMILGGQEVGESGLGGLTEEYGSFFQTDYLVAAIITSTGLAMMLFGLLKLFQHRFYPWIAASAAPRR
jgi:ABC-type nitrate/sulfonate/bicarbonate transport system permease component